MNAILGVDPARRHGRRPDALQPAQDLLRPSRRRRPRRGADRRSAASRALPAGSDRRLDATTAPITWTTTGPKSIGRVRSFFGNVGVLVRAYCYIRSQGPDGLRSVADHAVLNANYLLALVKHVYARALRRPLHARVRRVGAHDGPPERRRVPWTSRKRLLDHNIHAPTVYFPLIVPEALMIEPTETESRETLDRFAEILLKIAEEDPNLLHEAPVSTPISRPDEVAAARHPILKWSPASEATPAPR